MVDQAAARAAAAEAVARLERGTRPRRTLHVRLRPRVRARSRRVQRHRATGRDDGALPGGAPRSAATDGSPVHVRANLVARATEGSRRAENESDAAPARSAAGCAPAQRRLATGEPIHDELIRGLARCLAAQAARTGASSTTGATASASLGEWSNRNGERVLALAQRASPFEGGDRAARRSRATRRDAPRPRRGLPAPSRPLGGVRARRARPDALARARSPTRAGSPQRRALVPRRSQSGPDASLRLPRRAGSGAGLGRSARGSRTSAG